MTKFNFFSSSFTLAMSFQENLKLYTKRLFCFFFLLTFIYRNSISSPHRPTTKTTTKKTISALTPPQRLVIIIIIISAFNLHSLRNTRTWSKFYRRFTGITFSGGNEKRIGLNGIIFINQLTHFIKKNI